jgi:hypothetical protein
VKFITSLTEKTVKKDAILKLSNASLFWIVTDIHNILTVEKSLPFARNSEHNPSAKTSENPEY